MNRRHDFLDPLAASPALFIGCCVVLGLLVGSFLNVVIYRVPIMMDDELARRMRGARRIRAAEPRRGPTFNLVVPRSACPACKAPITALQNVPVVSWLAAAAASARAARRRSARAIRSSKSLTGLLSGVVAWQFGFGWPALAGAGASPGS